METTYGLNHESSRMETFRLLSACYRLPENDLLEILNRFEILMAKVSEQSALSVQRLRKNFEDSTDIELLKIDFSKLFLGPYKLFAAPYGSVYLDGERKVMGESTLDVINRYQNAGLETSGDFKDAPDHITVELEFMYYLIFKELEAFSDSNPQRALDFVRKQKTFLEDHLMAWVPGFSGHIKKYAENPFYLNLAELTETVLKESYQAVCALLDCGRPDQARPADLNLIRA